MSVSPRPPGPANTTPPVGEPKRAARKLELPPTTDVPRTPRKKTKQYVIMPSVVVGVGLLWYLTGRLRSDVPTVNRTLVIIDTVRKGPFVRDVRASGTLVPEHIRIIAAVTAGRVEALPVPMG